MSKLLFFMKFALQADQRIEATPNALGVCPCCGTEMIAKCGNRKVWHWAHKTKQTCDHWWDNETQWHRDWKNSFPEGWQEVIHKADDGEKRHCQNKPPCPIGLWKLTSKACPILYPFAILKPAPRSSNLQSCFM